MGILDKFDLTGRTAVVTGGAGLLGSQFARTLAEAGASVIVADLDGSTAKTTAQSILDAGYNAHAVEVDVRQPGSTKAMVEAAHDFSGRADILVNSAALDPKFDPEHHVQGQNAFEDYPLDQWEQALSVNLTGMFLSCQAVVPDMLENGSGSIINLCSTYGLVGPDQRIYHQPGKPVQYKPVYYSVTKAGIMGLTRYLATYYSGKNLRVNALSPGGVFNDHDEGFVNNYAARTVLGRMADQDEMNAALLFLASDASSYMTGANLVVDGGWTAW
jgi:2-deoxy-D-gluconate 3-dehydrogenase